MAYPDPKFRKEVISAWVHDSSSTVPGEKMAKTYNVTCKDGTEKIVHFIPVRLATGEFIVSLEDVTERIRAQESLMRSHQELERLNRAKTKAVHHISHELKTPLSVIQGNIRILKQKLERLPGDESLQRILEALERNLARLFDISKETDEIFRVSQEFEAAVLLDDLEGLWQRIEGLSDLPAHVRSHLDAVKAWLSQYLSGSFGSFRSIDLSPFVLQVLEKVKEQSRHREVHVQVEAKGNLHIVMDPLILRNVVEGLLRNGIENTPNGGTIRVSVEESNEHILLHVTDYGVGITEENQGYLFDGLFHTKETMMYASKKPYDFGAGGKGLDLLRMKVYGQRFGFTLSMTSKRCVHIPTDQDECPGEISRCPHVQSAEECAASGHATFTVAFPREKMERGP
jgi:signal transduction histidine kinase